MKSKINTFEGGHAYPKERTRGHASLAPHAPNSASLCIQNNWRWRSCIYLISGPRFYYLLEIFGVSVVRLGGSAREIVYVASGERRKGAS